MDIADHRPVPGTSLYESHFNHLAKIDKLRANFTEADKVSLILGAINDENITSSAETANVSRTNQLAAYLRNKTATALPSLLQNKPFRPAGPSQSFHGTSRFHGPHKNHVTLPKATVASQPNYLSSCRSCGSSTQSRQHCSFRSKTCNYCQKEGHIERVCDKKRQHQTSGNSAVPTQNVRVIRSNTAASKFYKHIRVNTKHECVAFLDFGSDCSIIQNDLIEQFELPIMKLSQPITLSGFLGHGVTIQEYTECYIEIFPVTLDIRLYILK